MKNSTEICEWLILCIYRCEMSRNPNWPFAYEKYIGDTLETKVVVNMHS